LHRAWGLSYSLGFGLLSFDSSVQMLYGVAEGSHGSDCIFKIEPKTMRSSQLACLPANWIAFDNGLAVHEASQTVYLMTANVVNMTIDHSLTFGIDAATGKIVSQAAHLYGSGANEITFSLAYDSRRKQVVGLCSGTKYTPGKPWKGYYLCAYNLSGAAVKAEPIGDPHIFGDGPPPGHTQLPYPAVNGYGYPNRSYYCGFYFPPPPPPPPPPSRPWVPATDCHPLCNTTFSSCCADPPSGQTHGICMGYPSRPVLNCSDISRAQATLPPNGRLAPPPALPPTPPPWLITIDLDSGGVISTAKTGFPTGLVDLSFVQGTSPFVQGTSPKAGAARRGAANQAQPPPHTEHLAQPLQAAQAGGSVANARRSRPRMGLGNLPVLPPARAV
jgi:hypothetical protein